MGLVELAPLIVFGLYGGALADHVDRRTMLVWTALAQVALTAALLGNAVLDRPERVDHLRHRLPAGDRPVAAAAQPRGPDPAHGPPRRAARGRGGLVARHADRHPARTGHRRPAGRDRRRAVGLRRRRGRPGDRDPAVRGDAALPADGPEHPAEPGRHRRGHPLRGGPARTCSAPTSSTWSRCSWRCRSCCSRRSPRTCSTSRRRSGLLYTAESVGTLLATLTSGWTGAVPPPRPGRRRGLDVLGRRDRAGRAGAERLDRAAVPRPGRRRRHDQRHLPQRHLAPDDPGREARPAGRHRDAVLLDRPARRPGPLRAGGGRDLGARLDRQRRRALRARRRRHRCLAAGLLALRRPHRRARGARAPRGPSVPPPSAAAEAADDRRRAPTIG